MRIGLAAISSGERAARAIADGPGDRERAVMQHLMRSGSRHRVKKNFKEFLPQVPAFVFRDDSPGIPGGQDGRRFALKKTSSLGQ
jgi:hypothetical protein